jgi:hypothetical protein
MGAPMKGDFSRDTFEPRKRYSRVLQQQGRILLDADWNEQGAILLHYMRALARDLIGPHGGPAGRLGFAILSDESALPPLPEARQAALRAALAEGQFLIGAGSYYVEGVPVENEAIIAYGEQPGLSADDRQRLAAAAQPALAYLDVFERLVTCIEDPEIRDSALGGADTATRAQIAWRVRLLLPADVEGPFGPEALERLPRIGTGRLRASWRPRLVGLDNQLYRVEIHRGGRAGSATFKWSRANGSIAFPIRALAAPDATHATVMVGPAMGHGDRALRQGDVVELDGIGLLAVEAVDASGPDGASTVALAALEDGVDLAVAMGERRMLRLWDQPRQAGSGGALPVVEQTDAGPGGIPLDAGIEIGFAAGGLYRAGDYWLIPARPALGGLDWPAELGADGQPVIDASGRPIGALKPACGPLHAYAPLAFRAAGGRFEDCRRQFVAAVVRG